MPEWISKFVIGFFPKQDDDAMALFAWRQKAVMMTLLGILIGSYAASFLPFVKPPYAMASTISDAKNDLQKQIDRTNGRLDGMNGKLNTVIAQLHDGQVSRVNSDLIDATRYQCRAMNSNDKSTLPFWTRRLEDLEQSYQTLTGTAWQDVDCKSF